MSLQIVPLMTRKYYYANRKINSVNSVKTHSSYVQTHQLLDIIVSTSNISVS